MRKRLLIGLLTIGMIAQSLTMPVMAAPTDSANDVISSELFSEEQPGDETDGQTEKPEGDQSGGVLDEDSEALPGEESGEEQSDDAFEESEDNSSDEQSDDETDETFDETPEEEAEELIEDSEADQSYDELAYDDVSDGVYQAGAFSVFDESVEVKISPYSIMPYSVTPYATTSTVAEAEKYIYEQLKVRADEIDISAYNIPLDSRRALYSGVLNEHPDLYYVSTGFSYYKSGDIVTRLFPTYIDGMDDSEFQSGLQEALSVVRDDMTDLEKAIALHDYLVINCEYDYANYLNNSIPDASYSAYGVLADGIAVCQGYALAYKLLLNKVGIDCYMVTSGKEAMNHAWNLIVLGGEYYQVDTTWDDPTWDMTGRVVHTYMFRSDAEFLELDHYGWEVTSGSEVVDYKATDTRYDSAFWLTCRSPLVITEDGCYYVAYENSSAYIKKKESLADIQDTGKTVESIGKWYVWGKTSYYTNAFSGLFQMDGRLYYNDTTSIYSITPDGTDKRTEFTADTTDGYIYGSALSRGKIFYCLRQDPNFKGKETVLVADITVSSGGSGSGGQNDSDQDDDDQDDDDQDNEGLNLDNPTVEYTALDGTKISSTADGRPKVLIFYSNTSPNSRNLIVDVSAEIEAFVGVDVCAVEYGNNTKEEVALFKDRYGCDEIVFAYDIDGQNGATLKPYMDAGGIIAYTPPLICYIDKNNRLQHVSYSELTAGEVLSGLSKYCEYPYQEDEVYTITYVLKGGNNNSANPSTYTSETDTITLQDATKDGCRFEGWYTYATSLTKVTQIPKGSEGDITLYAQWSGGQDDDVWQMPNLKGIYRTLDGSIVSSAAEGRPKILIFYGNDCENSQSLISDISTNIEAFAGADFYAIETDNVDREEVAAFQAEYGCDEIVFSYDPDGYNDYSMFSYAYAVGVECVLPMICYIDAENILQYVGIDVATAEEVLDSLQRYCNYQYEAVKTYSITYELDGGTNSSENPTTYTSETDTIVLKDAVKDGYLFDGWYSDDLYSTRVTQIIKGSAGDITLYAKWIVDDQGDDDQDGLGLNYANFTAEFTALDGTKISSKAQGRPKLLIFYSNTCWNSRNTIWDISAEIEVFAGTDVYAIETKYGTKEEVAAFQEEYGCDEIVFSYDTGTSNSAIMWQYARAGGVIDDDGYITWPVICYIDADNRLQYVTTGLFSAEEVINNLRRYCNYQYMAPESYSIKYVLFGGINSSENPTTYKPGADTIILQDAVKVGYRFDGWYSDASYRTRVTRISKSTMGNITLYAKWISESGLDLPAVDITPSPGNVVIGLSGSYYTETAEKILERLNEIRLEACEEGVTDPDTEQPLTPDDYVPLRWSSDLEAIARLRAAEAIVSQGHTRPNGDICFSVVTSNNEQSWGENLAWNWDGLMEGIEQWYDEKEDWVNGTGGETGHYENIIRTDFNYVAIGAFRLTSGGWYSVAQEFSDEGSLDEQKNPEEGECIQNVEVWGSMVSSLKFDQSQESVFEEGETCQLALDVTVDWSGRYTGTYQAGGNWTSSDETILTVNDMGYVTAKSKGKATVSVSVGNTMASKEIMVYGKDESPIIIQPPTATTYKVGQKINLAGGKVTYMSGNTTKTADLKSSMISGFDSTIPGICKVNVTYNGYVSSFDTLIVEEPKLTATLGQKLSDVPLPMNEYGTYSWQDGMQTLSTVGVQTYGAIFTPNDINAFQELTDLQIQMTVQAKLDDSADVSLKNSSFTYNGTEQEPKVVVSVSDNVLVEGRDYTLSYQDNINAGEATVIIEGANCYFGSASRTFTIDPAQLTITAKDITLLIGEPIPETYEYEVKGWAAAGDDLITEPVITCDVKYEESGGSEKIAIAGRYSIEPRNADAGQNYIIKYVPGTLIVASEYVSCTVTFDVQGHGTTPEAYMDVRVGSTIGRPISDGEMSADGYRFEGWYQDAVCTKIWNFDTDIVQSDITLYAKWLKESENSDFALQEISDVYYTGKACKPAVSVYDVDSGALLKSGKDYQIKYYNNTNANKDGVLKVDSGTGGDFNTELPYVEIIGKGNYQDAVKVNFNILPASISDDRGDPASGVTLKVSDQLVTAKKVQKPFSSIKYVKSMKIGTDYTLSLTAVNVRDQSGRSISSEDFTLENQNVNVAIPAGYEGEFLLKVQGIGNYEGCICKRIYVTDKSHLIKNATITLGKNLKNVEFTGGPIELTPSEANSADTFTVKYDKVFLRYNKDYEVKYNNNDKVGKAELIITGMGEYSGSKTVTFNIKGKSFTAKTVTIDPDKGIEDQVYTGRAWTQNHVGLIYGKGTDAQKELTYGTDYTISYSKNVNKGTATMTFKGVDKAGYSGSFKKTFKITAQELSKVTQTDDMSKGTIVVSYTKAGAKPVDQIVLTYKPGETELTNNEEFELVLSNGKDYTLKYANNKKVANITDEKPPTITVKGKGNYTGELNVRYNITQADLDREIKAANITIKKSFVGYQKNKADGYAYKPSIKLMDGKTELRAGTDYCIEYVQNTQADYDAFMQKLEDDENYMQKLEDGTVSYDGVPRVVITEKENSNYVLSNSIIVPLPIYQTKLAKSNLTVEIGEAVYTGSQVKPEVIVYYQVEGGKIQLEEDKDYSISYGTNITSGKNKGSVTISGVTPYYGGDVTVKFDIVKKPIKY